MTAWSAEGWLNGAEWLPSPNFGPRRHGALPDLVVIHYTAMPSCAEAEARLWLMP